MTKDLEQEAHDLLEKVYDEGLDAGYKIGHDEGYLAGKNESYKAPVSTQDAYNQGLNDAWECAKKIYFMTASEILKTFGGCSNWVKHSAREALDKVKEFEQAKSRVSEQGAEIEIGDLVHAPQLNPSRTGVVVGIRRGKLSIVWMDGSVGTWEKSRFEKTGKHIDLDQLSKLMEWVETGGE